MRSRDGNSCSRRIAAFGRLPANACNRPEAEVVRLEKRPLNVRPQARAAFGASLCTPPLARTSRADSPLSTAPRLILRLNTSGRL